MKKSKLEKKLNQTWKELLKANVHHDEAHANELMREMIALEIKQKHKHD